MNEKKSFLLRLPPDLWEQLQQLATQDLRSVNAEIEFLLRQSLRARGRKVDDEDQSARR
ncbi:MAG: Arc family DNA-binding protein [Chthonomonas sp.]|nr:Arc family DNA-binding protein [Chthonomonas sp.]